MKNRLFSLIATFAGLCLPFVPVRAGTAAAYAPFDPAMPAGSAYVIEALRLHPTQFCLGFREVTFKAHLLDHMSSAEATAYMMKKDVPVVIGPGGVPYLADGHHTVRSLLQSGQADKHVYGHILANWRALSPMVFWTQMEARHYAYLKDAEGRGPLNPAALSDDLLGMQSDPYRSLAWGVLVRHGFKEVKGASGFFQEFHWGDFFRSRIHWDDRSDAAFQKAVSQALVVAKSPEASGLPGYLPTSP